MSSGVPERRRPLAGALLGAALGLVLALAAATAAAPVAGGLRVALPPSAEAMRPSAHRLRGRRSLALPALDPSADGPPLGVDAVRAALEAAEDSRAGPPLTGPDLRALVLARYGKAYDTRICKRQGRFYLEIMWFFEGQKAFPLTAAQFEQQLEAVADTLTDWRVQDQVRSGIAALRKRPVMDTTGAKAVLIPLALPPDADTTGW